MSQLIQFYGQSHEFPDDFTQDDISNALQTLPPPAEQVSDQQQYYQRLARDLPAELNAPNPLLQPSLKQAAIGVPVVGGLINQTPEDKAFEQEHPYVTKGARIAGAIAGTAPAVMMAPELFGLGGGGLLARSLMSATTGGSIAGADAVTRGQPVMPAIQTGAAFGLIVPGVGQATGYGAGKLADAMAPAPSGILAGTDPMALKWATSAAKADGLTDAQITQKFTDLGPQGFLAEYGPNMKGLAGAIATQPGEGKATVIQALDTRAAGGKDQIENAVTNAFGPRINLADATAQREAARKAATAPLYTQFRNTIIPPTPELNAIIQLPAVQKAMPKATEMAANEGVPILDPRGNPTAQTWDYVKRAMDDQARAAGFGTNEARIANGISQRITSAIDNHPDPNVAGVWKAARQAYADPIKIQEAQEAGQSVFKKQIRPDELQQQINGYSQPEKDAFIQGARDSVASTMDATARGDVAARQMFLSDANQQKSAMLIGQQKTDELAQEMQRHADFSNTRSVVSQGSQTAPRQAMSDLITPDPSQTWVSRARTAYSPHVTPLALPLKPLESMATEAQAARYEQGRNALAPMLMQQGSKAHDFAQALLKYAATRPSQNINPSTQAIVNMLMQGASPSVRQAVQR